MTVHAVRVDLETRLDCEAFLYLEAECLDERRLQDWLALLTEDVDYRVPIRVTRERLTNLPEFSPVTYHLQGDLEALRARVARYDTEYAWAEDPPSRTRRFVSNVRVRAMESAEHLSVRSNLLIFRARGDAPAALLSCERHDILRRSGENVKLARRSVYLDHTALPWENMALFL